VEAIVRVQPKPNFSSNGDDGKQIIGDANGDIAEILTSDSAAESDDAAMRLPG
jgi:hypothetical protein